MKRNDKAPVETAAAPRRFAVGLNCPTPLALNPLEVEAENEHEAWLAFCRANGIGGSEHSRTIRLVDDFNEEMERKERTSNVQRSTSNVQRGEE